MHESQMGQECRLVRMQEGNGRARTHDEDGMEERHDAR